LKLAATFQFEIVTCPGVQLNDKSSSLALSVYLLGKRFKSLPLPATFPILIHEQFHVEKVFTKCTNPFQLGDHLQKENVLISLLQDSKVLAECKVSLKEFLYSKTNKKGGNLARQVLITRCSNFPGILSPKMEFVSSTSIREVIAKPKFKQATLKSMASRINKSKTVQVGKGDLTPCYMNSTIASRLKVPKVAATTIKRPETAKVDRIRPQSAKARIRLENAEYKPTYTPQINTNLNISTPLAKQIYQDALEDAKIQRQLDSIRVNFDNTGTNYWTNHGAFNSGKSHRQIFNSLLDAGYNSFHNSIFDRV